MSTPGLPKMILEWLPTAIFNLYLFGFIIMKYFKLKPCRIKYNKYTCRIKKNHFFIKGKIVHAKRVILCTCTGKVWKCSSPRSNTARLSQRKGKIQWCSQREEGALPYLKVVGGPMTPYTPPFWRLAGISGDNGSTWV